jgi:tRNA-specific 2-thiouridylase
MTKTFAVRDVNWLAEGAQKVEAQVKLRSAQAPVDAEIRRTGERDAEVTLLNPREAVAPGQACVIYAGERVLGGGWISPAKS